MENFRIFTLSDEKKGYPFFCYSSFYAWILFKDGNKRVFHSIETDATISQIIAGKKRLEFDLLKGYNGLIELLNSHSEKISKAAIYLNYDNLKKQWIKGKKSEEIERFESWWLPKSKQHYSGVIDGKFITGTKIINGKTYNGSQFPFADKKYLIYKDYEAQKHNSNFGLSRLIIFD